MMEELDMSKFDMSDFADLMKAIRKIGLMQMMKKEMSKSEQGDEMKMPADNPIEEAREFGEYSPFEDDEEEETGEMEDMAMKPKKKEYTMFSVKSDSPKIEIEEEFGDKNMGRRMRKKLMDK